MYESNEALPAHVRLSFPDPAAQDLWRETFNKAITPDGDWLAAMGKAFVEVHKLSPTAGDVHVDAPLGTPRRRKEKDDPGTEEPDLAEVEDEAAEIADEPSPSITKFVPPTEVVRAAREAWEAGTSMVDITSYLAEGEGLSLSQVRKIADHFSDPECATDPVMVLKAWGGKRAGRWALRAIEKANRTIWPSWIAVDFDNTLAEPTDSDELGPPIPAMVEQVRGYLAQGKTVKVFTARVANDPDGTTAARISEWCKENIGQALEVTNAKDPGTLKIVDDIAEEVSKKGAKQRASMSGVKWVTIHGTHIPIGGRASGKSELAKKNYKPSTAAKQQIADRSEAHLSKHLGMERTKDNSPFDLVKGKTAVEVKTLVDNKNDKITMHPESRQRKLDQAKKEGLRVHTVVVDARGASKSYYYSAGVGSFRIGSMKKVSLSELPRHLSL